MINSRDQEESKLFLRELLEEVEIRTAAGDPSILIKGIAYDSRQVEPGFLFVAIEGFNTDGHEYINEAIKRGAAAVVIQRDIDAPDGPAWVRVYNTRHALAC